MKTDNKQLALLDYCLPDYFSGYHLPVIAIPVYDTMSNKDVADAIEEELNYLFDYFELWNNEEDAKVIRTYLDELYQDQDNTFIEVTAEEKKEIEEYESPAYLYFSIINPVYKYGIMFLNP